MTEDRREQPLRIGPRQREIVGMADAGRLHLDQHLAGPRAFELDFGHDKGFSGLNGQSSASAHGFLRYYVM
ncbi:hypothetical protein KGO5_06047 [Sinorhizobium sp. KGO-5]|nr:hypothetical protein KGO5_06047 [Sinorhizobium sp. KGO-5]